MYWLLFSIFLIVDAKHYFKLGFQRSTMKKTYEIIPDFFTGRRITLWKTDLPYPSSFSY